VVSCWVGTSFPLFGNCEARNSSTKVWRFQYVCTLQVSRIITKSQSLGAIFHALYAIFLSCRLLLEGFGANVSGAMTSESVHWKTLRLLWIECLGDGFGI
jgi:hypothetical protein